jgi:threonine efflux protein
MLEVYLVTLAGLVLGQMAPGPNLLAVAGAALGQGRRAAVFVTLGVATAIFVWVSVAAFGLASVLALYPSLLTAMKLLGGGYLCWLALNGLRAAWRGGDPAFRASQADWTPLNAWRHGLLVNITNPKSALLWAAVSTFLFGSGLSAAQVWAFAPIGFASALVVYGAYGLLFSSGLARRAYARSARSIEALFGLAFGAIGGKLVADGIREIGR